MKTIMFSMGQEGSSYFRTVKDLVTMFSTIGGFITSMYYSTFFSYRFLADPFTNLKLAETFNHIIEHGDHEHTHAHGDDHGHHHHEGGTEEHHHKHEHKEKHEHSHNHNHDHHNHH